MVEYSPDMSDARPRSFRYPFFGCKFVQTHSVAILHFVGALEQLDKGANSKQIVQRFVGQNEKNQEVENRAIHMLQPA